VTREQVDEMAKKYYVDGEFEVNLQTRKYVEEVFVKAMKDCLTQVQEKTKNKSNKKKGDKSKWFTRF
jgi:hypothetical protein